MARIDYDDRTATAYKQARGVPRDGQAEWREAIRRHLEPKRGMTVADIGAGTGQFTAALSEWFGLGVVAVEPSAATRAKIPNGQNIEVREGHAEALPLADDSVDGAWMSLMIHHVPDLEAAAREVRRVLRTMDTLRRADATMRVLTDAEFQRGKERLRRAIEEEDPEPRRNWLDLLALR